MMEMENKQKRVPAADFVRVWQGCESRQEVADRLGVTYGSVASREKTLRKVLHGALQAFIGNE